MHYNRYKEAMVCDSEKARADERQKEVRERLEMLGVRLDQTRK
jgi:hypothetical protein